jgi:predicted nucleic acid-binding protein
LEQWLYGGVANLPVVDIDAQTAHIWAVLNAELGRLGRAMPVKDSLIAASARQHGLAIATRNVADYRYAGVPLVNPFEP